MTTKLVAEVSVSDVAATVMTPVAAPAGTVAVIEVSEFTVKLVAARPLNETPVAPVKPTPVSVTTVPSGPKDGVKEVSVGVTTVFTVNAEEEVEAPSVVCTCRVPVLAPAGTTAVIWVALFTVTEVAATPLNLTEVAPVKLVPVITTVVPAPPEVGVKLLMVDDPGIAMAHEPPVNLAGAVAAVVVPGFQFC